MTDSKIFHVEIVTPAKLVYEGEASAVNLPGSLAPFTVLVNHAPIVTELEVGDIRITDTAKQEHHFATSGGFAEMKDNRLSVIAETIEQAEQIDIPRAQRARARAEENIRAARTHTAGIDQERAEAALARAINRIRVAERA